MSEAKKIEKELTADQIEQAKREECSKKVTEILTEYGYSLGIVGFCLVPGAPVKKA